MGHIHVGYDNHDIEYSANIIKAMDLFLGVPSVIIDKDTKRKLLYGKAGAFRPQPWGCEYRVLSNFWIFDRELRKWAFNSTLTALYRTDEISNLIEKDSNLSNSIINCINKADKNEAYKLINKFKINMPNIEEVIEINQNIIV